MKLIALKCAQCGNIFYRQTFQRFQKCCSPECGFLSRRVSPTERFWAKVQKTDGCWLWIASNDGWGYGVFHYPQNGKRNAQGKAHRFSWELHRGPIPDSLSVLHRCDNPACVNPDHLFLGTHQDNMSDMVSKGRSGIGVDNPKAKLTDEDVREIRAMKGSRGRKDIAIEYGVTKENISAIFTRRNWAHVQ